MNESCCLVLADGTEFPGNSFGAPPLVVDTLRTGTEPEKAVGEIVFNTGMSGYHEIVTDPSYTGQLVAMTYPLIGNYGVDESWNEVGPEQMKRPVVKAAGLIVRKLYDGPLPGKRDSLHLFLERNGTPGIQNVDTRALTLRIRDGGSVNGVIVRPSNGVALSDDERERCVQFLSAFPLMEGRDLIGNVGAGDSLEISPDGLVHMVVVDCGVKANILRELGKRNVRTTVVPSSISAQEILDLHADGVLFSNGPGDPGVLTTVITCIEGLVGKVPLFGICLGHQLICRAIGAKTRKMKFGHHGVNHPVRDEFTRKVFVTSQNHGFDVDEESLGSDVEVWFRNANDHTIEGIKLPGKSLLSVQFHPEAAPGPHDSRWIFDDFVKASVGGVR